jgi:hypothetical protein
MRKLWVAGTAVVMVFALAAIAIAQDAVQNTYTVDASTSPAKAGKKKRPIPIGIKFDYAVDEVQNRRPDPVKKYSIRFAGTQVNGAVAATCTKTRLEQSGPSGCPARSIVGSGFIENETGARDNPNDKSVICNASVTVVNDRARKANLWVAGSPNSTDNRTKCAIELASAIPANFVRRGNETALEFVVPDSLLHPLPTLSNAVKRVTSNIRRMTKRIRGKNRGFFEAIGGCKNNSRLVTVVFTPENGTQQTAQDKAPCRR